MKFCRSINKKNAVQNAMKLVRSSVKSVHMTMDMQGEIDSPLPKTYHNLIEQKAKQGIQMYRYTYGKKTLFNKIKSSYKGVKMYYCGTMNNYQRMLIIDKKIGMFGLNGNIYFTRFEPLIKSLLDYAKIK
ncbi:MAG: hypothetical protein V1922_05705 [bacterium]